MRCAAPSCNRIESRPILPGAALVALNTTVFDVFGDKKHPLCSFWFDVVKNTRRDAQIKQRSVFLGRAMLFQIDSTEPQHCASQQRTTDQ